MLKALLQQAIDSRINEYQREPARMISDFNAERQHIDDYNGRQLLELIQNADDEQADIISIHLDTASKKLTISNTGNSFSRSGYESLMLSNLSSKTKEQFIGNKGLGFRSIINWSEDIIVRSNGFDIEFSETIAKNNFNDSFNDEKKKEIRNKRNLSAEAVPWAVLSTPFISQDNDCQWATEIEISYKEKYQDDIHEQIDGLKKETLLFLNNLDSINITIDDVSSQMSRSCNADEITIEGAKWRIYSTGNQLLPTELQNTEKNEAQHYNLKIALPVELEFEESCLYSFFPTKIELDFPFLVHGTFDLDSSRNQLNDTDKNRYILEKLVDHIVDVAKGISSNEVNWEALKILSYKTKNTVLDSLGLYDYLEAAKESLPVFPCVDQRYRALDDVTFISDSFSKLIDATDGIEWFPNIIKPFDSTDLSEKYYYQIDSDVDDLFIKINAFSDHLLTYPLKYRVSLISEMVELNNGGTYNLLLNSAGTLVSAIDEEIFTPLTSNIQQLDFPNHINIEFINNELYKKLLENFSLTSSEQKPRELQRILKEVTNIHSYEPAELISKVISATNKLAKENPEHAAKYIKDTVTSLYHLYIQFPDEAPKPKVGLVLINKNSELVNANELYFSASYPSGVYAEKIFLKVHGLKHYLAEINLYGFESNDVNLVEKFFLWLGVAKFLRYTSFVNDPDYISLLQKKNGVHTQYRTSDVRTVGVGNAVLSNIIDKCSLEEIVLWLCIDDVAKALLIKSENAKYSLSGEYHSTYQHTYQNAPSFFQYQLLKRKIFEDYWITDDELLDFINTIKFDYDYLTINGGVNKGDINDLLIKLGAKERFEELSIARVNNVLRSLPENDAHGKQSQKIYKLALEHYRKNNIELDKDLLLFARTKDSKGYYSQPELYYSDNVRLPMKLIEGIPILNLPKRLGGQQVQRFFHVKDLNQIEIDVISHDKDNVLTQQFERELVSIKPYILAYRIENIQKYKKREAQALSGLNIILCGSVIYKSNGEEYYLEDNDYVEVKSGFLVKVNTEKNLKLIILDSEFGDTFSEIVNTVFRVTEHRNEIRAVLRNNKSDSEHSIRKDFGDSILIESRELLGISDYFVSFWKSVSESLSINFQFEIIKENTPLIAESLGINNDDILDLAYSEIEIADLNELQKFLDFFEKIHVNIHVFNKYAHYKISLYKLHQRKFGNCFNQQLRKFKYLLWLDLCQKPDAEKASYTKLIGQYDHNEDWIESKSKELYETVNVDYIGLVFEFIKVTYSIDLEQYSNVDYLKFDNIYSENIKSVSLEDDTELPENIRSYLFFVDCLEYVAKYLQATDHESEINNAQHVSDKISSLPKESSATKASPRSRKSTKQNKPSRHSPKVEKNKKESGKKAEKVVYDSLVKEYETYNVDHVSLRDDSVGYDIKYSSDKGASWKYVEVKRYSNNQVFISKNELSFAEKNKSNYELFLVDADEYIHILKDVDFNNEGSFTLEANDYVLRFKLID